MNWKTQFPKLEIYKFTRPQFAKQVGINKNTLRMRMRKGKYKKFYIEEDGKYWFREWPLEARIKSKIRNRGGHDKAVKEGKYPNKAFEKNNATRKYLAAKGELTDKELAMVPEIEKKLKEINDNDEIVYFSTYFDPLVSKEDRLIKIGKSKDRCLENRLRGAQTDCPYELTLLTYVKEEIEEFYHEKFKEHRVRGEWFKYLPVIEYLKKEYEGNYMLPENQIENFRKIILKKSYSNDISRVDEKFNNDSFISKVWFDLKVNKEKL